MTEPIRSAGRVLLVVWVLAAAAHEVEAQVEYLTDGDPTAFTVIDRAPAEAETEFVYQSPALTTFDRFAVPNVVETPSPTATFSRVVEVHGSASSATDGFVLLASVMRRLSSFEFSEITGNGTQ